MGTSSSQLWCVHVIGPDDVIPAPDQETAARWAKRINDVVAAMPRPPEPSDNWPRITAEAAPWPWCEAPHAEGPSEEYRWLREEASR